MGGLLAFRVDNFNRTAEREQFRFLCQQLRARYEGSEDFYVLVGNYNIGCELDALFIKKDAIISIEFKNYGGTIIANENGEWTADGITIKGGSRKTVLQQARINHSTVKRELKALGVERKQIKDVPHLVVFHQPIKLLNRLSMTNKSWLHITDNAHFTEKLDDITCPNTDLGHLDIINLAELLNLNPFYLNEFSNATSVVTNDSKTKDTEDSKIDSYHKVQEKYVEVSSDGTVTLPIWLDDYIFNHLNASYQKANIDMIVLEWSKTEILEYLGTYFPRTFAESHTIFRRFFETYPSYFNSQSNISIFDFGCGTGGELVGFILALKEFHPKINKVCIKALDGNTYAMRLLELILNKLATNINIEIALEPLPMVIDDFYDFTIVAKTFDRPFDCILSFKAIGELVTKQQFEENNPYKYIIDALMPKLTDNGIMCIADVTTYNDISQEWLPYVMDNGINNPEINLVASNSGYNEKFTVSHSKKNKDNSKVAWRILSATKRKIIA